MGVDLAKIKRGERGRKIFDGLVEKRKLVKREGCEGRGEMVNCLIKMKS